MKKFIVIILGILLIGCCSASEQNSIEGVLIKKTQIKAHHSENCSGHTIYLGRIDFEQEGHDMWMFFPDKDGGIGFSSTFAIVHSPKCRLCHPENQLIVEETTTTSDYWGW